MAAGATRRRPRFGSRMRVPALVLALGLAAALGLTGCGSPDDNPYRLSEYSGGTRPATGTATTGSAASSPGSSPGTSGTPGSQPTGGPTMRIVPAPAGALTYTPADLFTAGAWVERGTIVTVPSARAAVVDAALAFLALRVQLSNTWLAGEPALTAVASGQALQNMRDRMQVQRLAERRSVGPFTLNLSSVKVSGSHALVSGCSYDGTVEVSTQGSVLSDPPGAVALRMDLQRNGDRWRVTTFPTKKTYCEGPGQ